MLNIFKLRGDDLKKWNWFILFVLAGFAFACVMITLTIIGGGTLYFGLTNPTTQPPVATSTEVFQQVQPTVDMQIFVTPSATNTMTAVPTVSPTATPDACQSFNDYLTTHTASQVIDYIETWTSAPTHYSNGQTVPANVIYYIRKTQIKITYELAIMLKVDEGGSVLRTLQPVSFSIQGNSKEDPCAK